MNICLCREVTQTLHFHESGILFKGKQNQIKQQQKQIKKPLKTQVLHLDSPISL